MGGRASKRASTKSRERAGRVEGRRFPNYAFQEFYFFTCFSFLFFKLLMACLDFLTTGVRQLSQPHTPMPEGTFFGE